MAHFAQIGCHELREAEIQAELIFLSTQVHLSHDMVDRAAVDILLDPGARIGRGNDRPVLDQLRDAEVAPLGAQVGAP